MRRRSVAILAQGKLFVNIDVLLRSEVGKSLVAGPLFSFALPSSPLGRRRAVPFPFEERCHLVCCEVRRLRPTRHPTPPRQETEEGALGQAVTKCRPDILF